MGPGRGITVAAAGGFVGLLSLFNLLGRFFWSSLSDKLGRKPIYLLYFGLGVLLYALLPTLGRNHSLALFVAACCVILSMYGGGFATMPAFLSDMFGKKQVGAIHGRVLTAWSTAGVLGPLLVNYLHDKTKSGAEAYQPVFYAMAGLLVIGFLADSAITAVNARYNDPHPELSVADAGH